MLRQVFWCNRVSFILLGQFHLTGLHHTLPCLHLWQHPDQSIRNISVGTQPKSATYTDGLGPRSQAQSLAEQDGPKINIAAARGG